MEDKNALSSEPLNAHDSGGEVRRMEESRPQARKKAFLLLSDLNFILFLFKVLI